MNDEFIIIEESELPEEIQEDENDLLEPLDNEYAIELAYECEVYGVVLVEDKYIDEVCSILGEVGYRTSLKKATPDSTYISI